MDIFKLPSLQGRESVNDVCKSARLNSLRPQPARATAVNGGGKDLLKVPSIHVEAALHSGSSPGRFRVGISASRPRTHPGDIRGRESFQPTRNSGMLWVSSVRSLTRLEFPSCMSQIANLDQHILEDLRDLSTKKRRSLSVTVSPSFRHRWLPALMEPTTADPGNPQWLKLNRRHPRPTEWRAHRLFQCRVIVPSIGSADRPFGRIKAAERNPDLPVWLPRLIQDCRNHGQPILPSSDGSMYSVLDEVCLHEGDLFVTLASSPDTCSGRGRGSRA